MKINITLSGDLDGVAERVTENLNSIVLAAAERVAEAAREACPVDTGKLRNSISVSAEGNSAVVSANTDYAAYVEFGTSKQSPQPFLAPALIHAADITGGKA